MTVGHCSTTRRSSDAASTNKCSQLSTTTNRCSPCNPMIRASMGEWPGRGRSSSAATNACANPSGSRTGASSASHAPSAKRSSAAQPVSIASRVLPTPPGPTNVTNRAEPSAAASWTSSSSRPTKLDVSDGRRTTGPTTPPIPNESPSAHRPNTRSIPIPRNERRPNSTSTAPSRSSPRMSSAVAAETTTCPPAVTLITRAARFSVGPK